MLRSQLSILGLYQYNESIFDYLTLPEGIDREVMINEILSQCAELELLYTNFDLMRGLIKSWCTTELHIWERVLRDSTIEYNPIWNVDGTETETIAREKSGKSTSSTGGTYKNTTTDNNTHSVKGYNSNSWSESTKDEGSKVDNSSTTGNSSGSDSETESITTTRVRGGNIGVTMTQQLLNADLDLLPRLNTYQYIVNSFKRRFCLLVY